MQKQTKGSIIGEAGDGLKLLDLLENITPDLVILDISMPGLRGIEAALEIKRVLPDVKVLVLSMHYVSGHSVKKRLINLLREVSQWLWK